MKQKVLIFHKGLAPYRIDFFNEVNNTFNAKFYFDHKSHADNSFSHFSENYLNSKCNFTINYLERGFEFGGRSFRFGLGFILKKEKPEIVICNEYCPVTIIVFLYYVFFKKKFRLYTISDDSLDNCIKRKGLRSIVRNIVSKNIDGIIFPSKKVCHWYANNISQKPKTLELPIIHKDSVFREDLAKSLDIARKNIGLYNIENKKVILYVGRLVELKNLSVLINVFSKLNDPITALVIVGDGPLMNNLQELVRAVNISQQVYFTYSKEGYELLSWYAIAKLFVLPSTFEQFGAVVNEALLSGCNVLCSDRAGASSLITENNGLLFDPYNEEELHGKIKNMLSREEATINGIITLRENKMPFTFDEKIKALFANL
ncbi:Glycosyltransferase involved in cell wall bisynthesis [Arenibacter palladensis]|uniref:Glycosyltransferase involved in cell wall bisynthesis n=1 Tax=Arenibacter palladensis TaxID=237373 RepID=A0A1M5G4D1_9FLAO|nr:glycosyltransferase [Arenibacter palladensis]SHF98670.1 Glycosyltransferase involved in cell wall bisynthesis [Arenibacter palladensis]